MWSTCVRVCISSTRCTASLSALARPCGEFRARRGGLRAGRGGFRASRGGFRASRGGFRASRGWIQGRASRGGFRASGGGFRARGGVDSGSAGLDSGPGGGGFGPAPVPPRACAAPTCACAAPRLLRPPPPPATSVRPVSHPKKNDHMVACTTHPSALRYYMPGGRNAPRPCVASVVSKSPHAERLGSLRNLAATIPEGFLTTYHRYYMYKRTCALVYSQVYSQVYRPAPWPSRPPRPPAGAAWRYRAAPLASVAAPRPPASPVLRAKHPRASPCLAHSPLENSNSPPNYVRTPHVRVEPCLMPVGLDTAIRALVDPTHHWRIQLSPYYYDVFVVYLRLLELLLEALALGGERPHGRLRRLVRLLPRQSRERRRHIPGLTPNHTRGGGIFRDSDPIT
eukprot:1182744-Prorocentrum_minimum.AAC.4